MMILYLSLGITDDDTLPLLNVKIVDGHIRLEALNTLVVKTSSAPLYFPPVVDLFQVHKLCAY